MDKAFIESALARAKAAPAVPMRANVIANLEALLRHVRKTAGEKLSDAEAKLPACTAYTRTVDIETDLAALEANQ